MSFIKKHKIISALLLVLTVFLLFLFLDKNKKFIKLVSLERGMGVPILDGEYEGRIG